MNPMQLPSSGFQLRPGSQYVVDKYFRRAVREEYGYNLPETVVCLHAKTHPERAEIKVTNLVTGEIRSSVEERPGTNATFVYYAHARKYVFCVSCESLAEVRALNAEAEKVLDVERAAAKATKESKPKKATISHEILALIEEL